SAFELRNRLKRLVVQRDVNIPAIIGLTEDFLAKIDQVREIISKGEYVEPSKVSVMTWTGSSRTEWPRFSGPACEPLYKSDLKSGTDLILNRAPKGVGMPGLISPGQGRGKKERK